MNWLAVGLGGALGSLARYGIGRFLGRRVAGTFPWGTLTVNLVGAFLMGLLGRLHPETGWVLLLGTGFLGGLTTFSTWMVESLRLMEEGEFRQGFLNVAGTLLVGMLAYRLGLGV